MEGQKSVSSVFLLLVVSQTTATIMTVITTNTTSRDGLSSAPSPSTYSTNSERRQSDTASRGVQTSPEDNTPVTESTDLQAISTVSTLPDTTTKCPPSEQTLTGKTGTIAFNDSTDPCNGAWVWNIHSPSPEDGIMVKFIVLSEDARDTMSITSFSSGRTVHTIPDFNLVRRNPPFYLFRENRCKITLRRAWTTTVHTFTLTYTTYPARKMPRHEGEKAYGQIYNCTGDVVIPSVMRCNMVGECISNVDEAGCDYQHEDCGDWIPYHDTCLRFFFDSFETFAMLSDGPKVQPSLPSTGEKICLNLYGARLAQLKDMEGVNFVGRIARQAGYQVLVTGIRRVKTVSKNLRHLYRMVCQHIGYPFALHYISQALLRRVIPDGCLKACAQSLCAGEILKYAWQWGGKGSPIAYSVGDLYSESMDNSCAWLLAASTTSLYVVHCDKRAMARSVDGYVCMKDRHGHPEVRVETSRSAHLPRPQHHQITQFPTRKCADGSLVQTFHPCYHQSKQDTMTLSSYSFSQFSCHYGQTIHYTLVCDGHDDCLDKRDETECGSVTLPPLLNSMFICNNFQLVPRVVRCDGKYDCFDESDEDRCTTCALPSLILCPQIGCFPKYYGSLNEQCRHMSPSPVYSSWTSGPYVVELDGYGMAWLSTANKLLPDDFQCTDGNYVPSFLLNNGEQDCQSGEDENIPPENTTCPGFYRCQYSYSCVHTRHVCDRIHHCPYKDDERYCDIVCPEGCQCEGYAFHCTQFPDFSGLLLARYLDLSGSGNLSLNDIHFLEMLQFLNLSHCGLDVVYFKSMPQLQILDLSFNELRNVTCFVFERLSGLKYLNISDNLITHTLDATFVSFITMSGLSTLRSLVMRHTKVHSITDRAFNPLTQLEILDIRNSFIDSYDREVFWGLDSLQELYTGDSKLCCPYFHDSRVIKCVAPFDELSSCSDLLRQNIFRVFLWLVALLAIVGNASVMLYRLFIGKQKTFSSFRVLISNLCAADLIMGMYMVIIGIADSQFKGVYVTKEKAWKRSPVCKAAGLMGFVSSEASAMTICLITLDRVLVLCFPLKSHFHLTVYSSLAACCVLWFVAVTLVAVPLMAGLEFYGVSSICLPLPITRRQFSGQFYSFGVFIIFNFVLFVLIGLGQILIYRSILGAGKVTGAHRRSQEMTIARRLFLVMLSDFCCWFPVGLMGLLVAGGTPISDEVNVWTAIFVLPLNSALNPFLYTLNTVLEKWRAEKVERQTKKILGNIQTQLPKLPASTTEELLKICIRSNVVKRERILQMLHVSQDSVVSDSVSEFDSQTMSSSGP